MPTRIDRYVDAANVRIERHEGSLRPRIEIRDDRCILAAQVRRVFPLSRPDEYICLQDGAGEEVGILRSVEGLDPASRTVLDEELDRKYFTPVITHIFDLRQEAGMWHFLVDTQRGETQFYVRNWRDSAHEISPGRWQIFSVDGGRYDIPNLEALDAHSTRHMARLL